MLPLVERAAGFTTRPAVAGEDQRRSYADLLEASAAIASQLLDGRDDLAEARVAFLAAPGFAWVATQWGIWRAGGVAVPLATTHPAAELDHVLEDCRPIAVAADRCYAARLRPLAEVRGLHVHILDDGTRRRPGPSTLPDVRGERRAQLFYTSGTAGKPKGAVLTHANVAAQVMSLVEAWQWVPDDRILGVLPLHHVHGAVNVVTCALWSGACCELQPRFDAEAVWDRFLDGDITLFMAVPTIYAKLADAWRQAPVPRQRELSTSCRGLRLMVSGSAALPVSLLETWRGISGHTLLERYGMTETGMVLSNPLHGVRRPGHVGTPLPGVEVRLVSESGEPVTLEGEPGELEVRSPGVFKEYLGQPEATAAAFRDGWFVTGDVAAVEGGSYRILGRRSQDIIKTGGFKVSALEIEEVLREHPDVQDVAVVGLPDDEWGEVVAAAVVCRGAAPPPAALRDWACERLAGYKTPRRFSFVDALPRNAMGKVTKSAVAAAFAGG